MKKPVLILQQLACEPPALLAHILHEQRWEIVPVLVQENPTPETLDAYAGMIVMGGPMSADDTHLDSIVAELKLLELAIADDFPVLGICLGAQLLAKAAGATIHTTTEQELGWYPLSPTAAAANDPVFSHLTDGLSVFQWHGENFTLPAQATLLASCKNVPHQVFRLGTCQYGLQFHVEVNETIIRDWVNRCDSERKYLGREGVKSMLKETPKCINPAHTFCRRMTKAWIKML